MLHLQDIDSLLAEDLENPSHPSDFIVREKYSAIILRLPKIEKETISIVSYAFVLEGHNVLVFDRETKQLKQLGSYEEMIKFLDPLLEANIKEVQKYHYEIEMLEDSLFSDGVKEMFMQQWLVYKKDLSLIYRLMFHASFAFELFMAYHKKHKEFELFGFEDLQEHIKRIKDLSNAAKEKLDNLYDFYRAKVDEKMNKNMYYLTIISGVFLPLTLITGFFGMNTGGLPYVEDPHGTIKAVLLSVILEVVFLVVFFFLQSKSIKRFKRS